MSERATVKADVRANPNTTSPDISARTGIPKDRVSNALYVLFHSGEVVRRKVMGPPMMYSYMLNSAYESKVRKAYGSKVGTPQAPVDTPVVKQEPRGISFDAMVEQLVDAIATRVADELRPRLISVLSTSVSNIADEVVRYTPPKEKIRLKKIFVGGVLEKQGRELEKEFEGVAEIRWVTTDERRDVWAAAAKSAYAVIVWTDFVSHKHVEYVESAGVKPVLFAGTFGGLKDKIMEVCV